MNIVYTNQFKRDYRRLTKQNKDVKALRGVIEKLAKGEQLPAKHQDHKLGGQWKKHRDCHITPDWLLIYRIKAKNLILERTGSHSELFK